MKNMIDEETGEIVVANMTREETQRRKWCVEQAVVLEESRPENILQIADKIYVYVFGVQS